MKNISIQEIKALRQKKGISLIELSCYTGLPSGYLGQLEEEEVPAMESDLLRLERAILEITKSGQS